MAWTVGRILERVVADKLDRHRLDGLIDRRGRGQLRRGRRFLTYVADHVSGGVVWARPGSQRPDLAGFFESSPASRRTRSGRYRSTCRPATRSAIRPGCPEAEVAFDPVPRSRSSRGAAGTRSAARSATGAAVRDPGAGSGSSAPAGRCSKPTRTRPPTARKLAEDPADQPAAVPRLPAHGQLRYLYRLQDPTQAPARLDAWLAWASRSRLKPFVKLARTIRKHTRRACSPRSSLGHHQRVPFILHLLVWLWW